MLHFHPWTQSRTFFASNISRILSTEAKQHSSAHAQLESVKKQEIVHACPLEAVWKSSCFVTGATKTMNLALLSNIVSGGILSVDLEFLRLSIQFLNYSPKPLTLFYSRQYWNYISSMFLAVLYDKIIPTHCTCQRNVKINGVKSQLKFQPSSIPTPSFSSQSFLKKATRPSSANLDHFTELPFKLDNWWR